MAAGLGLALAAQCPTEEASKPQGPYVGQAPPGTAPVVFAPGFVCKGPSNEYGCTFTPDGSEFYFSRNGNTLSTVLHSDGWSKPKKTPWNTSKIEMEPHVTADGAKLWFSSNRKWQGASVGPGIWVMDRLEAGWGEPRYHCPGMYPTTAANGNLYYTDLDNPEGARIVMQRFEDGRYLPPEPLGDGVNGILPNAHPCIAADESYLIFDSRRPGAMGGEGDDDHYISFRNPDGTWGEAQHFDEISATGSNMCASLSPDGKYLFFFRDSDIWWVSAEVIERYRPGEN
jgi:Tol biopolymer transport system component